MWKLDDCWAVPAGDHPETVTVGETRVGADGEKRSEKIVRYEDWEGRCKVCYPDEIK